MHRGKRTWPTNKRSLKLIRWLHLNKARETPAYIFQTGIPSILHLALEVSEGDTH